MIKTTVISDTRSVESAGKAQGAIIIALMKDDKQRWRQNYLWYRCIGIGGDIPGLDLAQ